MNKILANQPSWLTPATHTRPEQGQNFAEALHGRSGEESRRAKSGSDHVAETRNSIKTISFENGRAPAGAVAFEVGGPGRLKKKGDVSAALASGNGDDIGERADPMLIGMDMDALSPGLLSGQVVWSRIYPEHLIASGYLSVVDTAEREGNGAAQHVAEGGFEIHADVGTSTPVANGEAVATRELMAPSSDPLPSQTVGFEDPAVATANAEIASSPRVPGAITLADHIWAQRLMRLTRDHDGEATVWLRDYGLKESDLTPFVSRLIQHGRGSGFQIRRIVINGREAWCATRSEGG